MKPIISIVVPVYQVEKYIENLMISICNQSYKSFEVILVNDGTEDNSIEIAERILRSRNVNYLILNQENRGVSAARNVGIRNSNGEWIVCVDPDDVLYKDFLEILLNSCIIYNTCVAFGNYQIVSMNDLFREPQKIYTSTTIYQEDILYSFLLRKIKIISPSILVRKDIIVNNNLWYDEDIRFSEDQHFIWRLLLSVDKVAYNKTKIYNYYIRENSTMASSDKNKILTGYVGFVNLCNENYFENYPQIGKHVLNRWVIGALRSSTKIMKFKDFEDLAKKMNYKKHFKALLTFPDNKIKLLSILAILNLESFYWINNKFKIT